METITRIRSTHEYYQTTPVIVTWELDGFNPEGDFYEWSGTDEYNHLWYGESKTLNGKIETIIL